MSLAETDIASATLIERFQAAYAATLDRLLPEGAQIVLLDYPSHRNIGDHLIWLGETTYLGRRRDLSVHFISDRFGYSHGALTRHLPREALILLHGGGNFGDLYPQVQRMREAIVEHFPHNSFIQLPQTVSFDSSATASSAVTAFQRHSDFTLLARDRRGFELAQETLSCKVELCVDAAFMLGSQPRTAPAERSIMWLARRDGESAHVLSDLPESLDTFDWDDLAHDERAWRNAYRRRRLWAAGLAELRARGVSSGIVDSQLLHAFDKLSWIHGRTGFQHLSRAQVLVTDRLHGHIMAVLLDLPHVLLDNADSKLRRFYDTWTHPAARAQWAEDPRQAFELAQALLEKNTVA